MRRIYWSFLSIILALVLTSSSTSGQTHDGTPSDTLKDGMHPDIKGRSIVTARVARIATYRAILTELDDENFQMVNNSRNLESVSTLNKTDLMTLNYTSGFLPFGLDNRRLITYPWDYSVWLKYAPQVPSPSYPPAGYIVYGSPGLSPSGHFSYTGHSGLSLGFGRIFEMPAKDWWGNRATTPRIVQSDYFNKQYNVVRSVPIPGASTKDIYKIVTQAEKVVTNPSGYYTQSYNVFCHNCIHTIKRLAQDVGLNLGNPNWVVSELPVQFYNWQKFRNDNMSFPNSFWNFKQNFVIKPPSIPNFDPSRR